MSKFIEMTSKFYNRDTNQHEVGDKFMMDMDSQWEIHDNGDKPATWVNNNLGMNKDVNDTYSELRKKFVAAGLLLDLDNMVPEIPTQVSGQSFEALYDHFLKLLPVTLAQDYVEQDHHPVALAFKAVLKVIADSQISNKNVIKRSDLHSLLMNKTNHTHSQVVHILDLIMPKIQG